MCEAALDGLWSAWHVGEAHMDGGGLFYGTAAGKGSVAEMAERQPPSGETGGRSLPAAPSRCGRVTSVLNSLVG